LRWEKEMLMQTHDATIIDEFEALSRTRALSDDESLQKMVRQRKKWVEMAAVLERTPEAVGRMLRKLREKGKCGYISAPGSTGRYPRKGSKAGEGQSSYEG
jgi:hypothetical protein